MSKISSGFSNTGVTSSYRTAFFPGLHGGACFVSSRDALIHPVIWPQLPVHTYEPHFKKKSWTRGRQRLARCREEFSSEKSFSSLGPLTQGLVPFLPEGHMHGPSSISLIITVDKPLKISFHFTVHPPFNWLFIIIILFLIYKPIKFNAIQRFQNFWREKMNARLCPLKDVQSLLRNM